MKRTPVQIRLDPDRCDRCGACVEACKPGALKVGPMYIYLDWRACDECYRCVEACRTGAITRRDTSRKAQTGGRGAATGPPAAGRGGERARPQARTTSRPSREKAAGSSAGGKVGAGEGWSLIEAVAVLAVVLLALLGKDAVLGAEAFRAADDSVRIALRVVVLGVFYALQLGLLAVLAIRHGGFVAAFRLGGIGVPWGSRLASAGLVLAFVVATRAAGWAYQVVVRALGWELPVPETFGLTEVFGPGMTGLALSVLLVVVFASITEELVFRGVLLDALTHRTGRWFALVAQAVLFALYHVTPWLWGPTLILGLACGWLAQTRSSLWPAIALHAGYNAVLVAAVFYVSG